MAKRIEKCHLCGQAVEVDTKRLDGGANALAHIERCEFNPRRSGTGHSSPHSDTAQSDASEPVAPLPNWPEATS